MHTVHHMDARTVLFQTSHVPCAPALVHFRFRRLQPDEDRSLATCNVLVMEYCDRASLRHAMKKGVFHKRLGNTSVAVDLCAIVQVGDMLAVHATADEWTGRAWGHETRALVRFDGWAGKPKVVPGPMYPVLLATRQ